MKYNIYFITIMICLTLLIYNHQSLFEKDKKIIDNYKLIQSNVDLNLNLNLNKITFGLKTSNGLNLTYMNKNFYLTDKIGYIFIGSRDTNGLYQLKNPTNNFNFILDYNSINTQNSSIILESDSEYNLNSNTVSNIFNLTNKNIYLDPVNKVILSNDNSGNIVYLSNIIIKSPVNWNYNLDEATIFDINYL